MHNHNDRHESCSLDLLSCQSPARKPRDLEMHRILRSGGKLVITDWCADYLLVRMYHWLERLRWWRFPHQYPGPLQSQQMLALVQEAGFDQVQIEAYPIRFYFIATWGMHTITATKSSNVI